jgi:hypothetical protein
VSLHDLEGRPEGKLQNREGANKQMTMRHHPIG